MTDTPNSTFASRRAARKQVTSAGTLNKAVTPTGDPTVTVAEPVDQEPDEEPAVVEVVEPDVVARKAPKRAR